VLTKCYRPKKKSHHCVILILHTGLHHSYLSTLPYAALSDSSTQLPSVVRTVNQNLTHTRPVSRTRVSSMRRGGGGNELQFCLYVVLNQSSNHARTKCWPPITVPLICSYTTYMYWTLPSYAIELFIRINWDIETSKFVESPNIRIFLWK